MIKQFVEYLAQIIQESYVLLLDRSSDVFEQINQRIANSEVCCVFDHRSMFGTCTYCICVYVCNESCEGEELEEMVQCILTFSEVCTIFLIN